MNIKEDYRNEKEKRKDFNYFSKGMLEFTITYIDFWNGMCICNEFTFFLNIPNPKFSN